MGGLRLMCARSQRHKGMSDGPIGSSSWGMPEGGGSEAGLLDIVVMLPPHSSLRAISIMGGAEPRWVGCPG